MNLTYWSKQTPSQPLYSDLLWSRPENKRQAGKLLIVGGSAQGFAAAGQAYAEAARAGVGSARVLLPDSLQKTVGRVLEAGEYAPSTLSGSFARTALATWLEHAHWADGALIGGDLGRNSETAVLLESFATKYSGQLTLTKDAADYCLKSPQVIINRPNTLLVVSFAQLQKLAVGARLTRAFTFDMDLIRLVEALREFSEQFSALIITKHLDNVFVAAGGQVSSTKLEKEQEIWRVRTAAQAAVWWLQNPTKPFEALTTSLVDD